MLQGILGNSKLLRNKNLEYRIKYYEQKKKNLQRNSDDNSLKDKIIVIVQYRVEIGWQNKCIVCTRDLSGQSIIEYMKNKMNIKDINGICMPKNKKTITANYNLGKLYDQYHDRDDEMLYLMILSANPFGGLQTIF